MSPTKNTTKTKAKQELPPNPFVHEILELVSKQRSRAKKVEILQKYEDLSLKTLFIWNFDDTVISVVPEGEVPYKENEVPIGTDHTSLRREYKHLYNFVKGGNDGLSSLRRETMFIQMLEGLHPEEAKILCLVKDKRLQTKYKLTYDVVAEAYPDIQWGGRS
mgnify:FL=1|jgi:hypothetical protein|tara:strand:+ start:74 stop:559 length:486 start_codon:yes stop_codon:yes gene_type:complete